MNLILRINVFEMLSIWHYLLFKFCFCLKSRHFVWTKGRGRGKGEFLESLFTADPKQLDGSKNIYYFYNLFSFIALFYFLYSLYQQNLLLKSSDFAEIFKCFSHRRKTKRTKSTTQTDTSYLKIFIFLYLKCADGLDWVKVLSL